MASINLNPYISIGGRIITDLSKKNIQVDPTEDVSTIVAGMSSVYVKTTSIIPSFNLEISVMRGGGDSDDAFLTSFINENRYLTSGDFMFFPALNSTSSAISGVQYDIIGGTFTRHASLTYGIGIDNAEEEAQATYTVKFAGKKRNL